MKIGRGSMMGSVCLIWATLGTRIFIVFLIFMC
jgi:hypothetical protein